MASTLRTVLGGFDRFSAILHGAYARYTGVIIQWIPESKECIAVAALDQNSAEIIPDDVGVLQAWTESLPPRVPVDAIRLLAPELDPATTGEFRITQRMPVAGLVMRTAAGWVEQEAEADTSLLVDALWLTLGAAGLPDGALLIDHDGQIAGATEKPDGTGRRVSWTEITARTGETISGWMQTVAAAIATAAPHTSTPAQFSTVPLG